MDMNNPMMMSMMQKLMADPDVVALMQKPGVMAKLQQIMSNPANMMSHMSDPDVALLLRKLQGFQGNSAPPSNPMNNLAQPINHESKFVVHINNVAHFQSILQQAGQQKIVVVDFFATWCGPCKQIAPAFQQLASTYPDHTIFCKVDGDKCPELCRDKGVSAYPTFQIYLNHTKVDEWKGADERTLSSKVGQWVQEITKEPASPFKHFPLKDTEKVEFKDCKYDTVEQQLKKTNASILESKEPNALSDTEMNNVIDLAKILADVGQYQNSILQPSHYQVLDKMLSWPEKNIGAALHYMRMVVRHPAASKHYSLRLGARSTAAEKAANPGIDIISRLCDVAAQASRENKSINAQLALRALCNMFSRRNLCLVMGEKYEILLDKLAEIGTSQDQKVRLVYANVLLNLAIFFNEDRKRYSDARVQMLSGVVEQLVHVSNTYDVDVTYRLLVILGSLLYRDATCFDLAEGLEILKNVQNIQSNYTNDVRVSECCSELIQLLQSPQ